MMALLAQQQLWGMFFWNEASPSPQSHSSKQLPTVLCVGWVLALGRVLCGPMAWGAYTPFYGLGGSLLALSILGSGRSHPPLHSCRRQRLPTDLHNCTVP